MPRRIPAVLRFNSGFFPTQAATFGVEGSILSGQNVWCYGTLLQSSKGTASAGSSGGANPLMNVGSSHGGVSGGGTVYRAFGVTWAAGTGTAYEAGSSIGTVSGNLRLKPSGSMISAGTTTPTAPTISDSGIAGKNSGSYSVCITAIRFSSTGHESSRSLPSSPLVVAGKKITVTFPAVPTDFTTSDKWGIYVSFKGFATTGPWFHHSDVLMSNASADIDWYNGELGDEAATDHDPPPACTHAFSINSVNVAAGAYGGAGLSPSIPGKPEAFPPEFTLFIPGGGAITGCKATGPGGSVFVSTAASLTAVIGTQNADVSPIAIQQIWPTTGFATGSAWCTVYDQVYGFTGQRGAVRGDGDNGPDSSFAIPVQKFFADNGYTASNTVVGFDPKTNCVMFMSGTNCLPYDLTRGIWHTNMVLSASAVTCATVSGQLLVDVGSGSLVSFESGSGTTWNVVPVFIDFGSPEYNHTVCRVRVSSSASMQADVLTNEDTSTSQSGALSVAAPHSDWFHTNVRNAKTATVKISGTGQGQSIYEIELEAIAHPVTR